MLLRSISVCPLARSPMSVDTATVKARLTDIQTVLAALGLSDGARREGSGTKIRCPWHGERTPSCNVQIRDGVLLAHCHACNEGGDVFSLLAAVRGLDPKRDFREVSAEAARLAGLEPGVFLAPTPRPAPAPRPRPPLDEVAALWAAAAPVSADPATAAWLTGRGLDPAAVDLRGLARALPSAAVLPRWARYQGSRPSPLPWTTLGYRLLLPVYDAEGTLTSLRARRIEGSGEGDPKTAPPSGYAAGGLVMLDPLARLVLQTGGWPWTSPRRLLLVAEGEPDFLTWATQGGTGVLVDAVVGLGGSGAWTRTLAERIPNGSTVVIWTDADDAGDRYAEMIAASLAGRCTVRESDVEGRTARRAARPGAHA